MKSSPLQRKTALKKSVKWGQRHSFGKKWKPAAKRKDKRVREEASAETKADLEKELDTIFSKYMRLAAANHEGYLKCYICQQPIHWEEAHLMHFQPRQERTTRWNEKACKPGCPGCNGKDLGDRANFAKRLDEEYGEGTAESLTILSKQYAGFTVEYIKGRIAWYRNHYEQLQKRANGVLFERY